jgi:hypothetical protein
MTTTIWKFPFDKVETIMQMPEGASIVRVAMQHRYPTVWAQVNPDAPKLARRLRVFGTGEPIPDGWHYVGSCDDREFVWHVFEQR